MSKVYVQYVDESVLGTCPASIDMTNGVISINTSVWDRYDNFEKAFVIFHELGHYNLDTDSEYEADKYALHHVYKTAPRSLKRSLQTLCKIRVIDATRLDRLYEECLKLDAADGNQEAYLELIKISNINNNKITGKMTNKTANTNYVTRKSNKNAVKVVRFADGGSEKSHKTNGVKLGNMYFSFTNILLMIIVLIMLFKKN